MVRVNPKADKDTSGETKKDKDATTINTQTNTQKADMSPTLAASWSNYQSALANVGKKQDPPKTPDAPKETNTKPAPYARTQNPRGKSTIYASNSQNKNVTSNEQSNQAQPQGLTYATNASGQSYEIPIAGQYFSLEARQYYKKLGITLSSQPPAGYAGASGVDVIVDPNLSGETNTDDPKKECSWFGCPTVPIGIDVDPAYTGTLGDPVDSPFDNDLPATKDKEDNPVANDVNFGANNGDTTGVNVPNADPRWNDGKKLWDSNLPLQILDSCPSLTKSCVDQWMSQFNEQIIPTNAYEPFTQNGNGNTGSASIDSGIKNIKTTFGNILQSKYFPFLIIGIVGLIALKLLRGKGTQAPTKVINF